jgi:hypothetical protein
LQHLFAGKKMGDYNVLKATMAGYHQPEVTVNRKDVIKYLIITQSK